MEGGSWRVEDRCFEGSLLVSVVDISVHGLQTCIGCQCHIMYACTCCLSIHYTYITSKCSLRPRSVIICTLSPAINGGAQCLLSSNMPVEEPFAVIHACCSFISNSANTLCIPLYGLVQGSYSWQQRMVSEVGGFWEACHVFPEVTRHLNPQLF